jgi:hypothetical protein
MKIKKTTITVEINNKPRNPLAVIAHSLKAGTHTKSEKVLRQKAKIDLKKNFF